MKLYISISWCIHLACVSFVANNWDVCMCRLLECSRQLSSGEYFMRDGNYYCTEDYRTLFAVRCRACGTPVEGDVVSALDNIFHPNCFQCFTCKYANVLCCTVFCVVIELMYIGPQLLSCFFVLCRRRVLSRKRGFASAPRLSRRWFVNIYVLTVYLLGHDQNNLIKNTRS